MGVREEAVDSFIEHYGVKGMRWGKTKGRQYDNTERILKKGTELQTVTAGGKANLERRVFTSHTDKDKLRYQSTYARTLKVLSDNQDTYVNTLVPKKDLKVASEKVAFDTFKKMYEDDKPGMILAIAESHEALTRTMLFMGDVKNQSVVDDNFKKYSKKGEAWMEKNGYDLFVTGAGASRTSTGKQRDYYREVVKQGYDAMVDHTDRIAKMADDPIVILEPKKSLKVTTTVPLSADQIKLASKAYKLKKKGE